jgi:hypothetical protein
VSTKTLIRLKQRCRPRLKHCVFRAERVSSIAFFASKQTVHLKNLDLYSISRKHMLNVPAYVFLFKCIYLICMGVDCDQSKYFEHFFYQRYRWFWINIFASPKSQFGYVLEGIGMTICGILTAIWYILWPFGIHIFPILVHFTKKTDIPDLNPILYCKPVYFKTIDSLLQLM